MSEEIALLVDRYSDMAFRLIFGIVDDRDEAFDIVQDLFIKIVNKPSLIDSVENKKGYILKTAYNMAVNHKRNVKSRRALEQEKSLGESVYNPITPEDDLLNKEKSKLLKTHLESLSEQQREMILCRFFGEMKLNEIADKFKINEATVRTHLKRALDKLKSLIASV